MEFQFEIMAQSRKNMVGILEQYNMDQLNHIPDGFKNNLIWNLGHVIASHQILCYQFCGLPFTVHSSLVARYKRGTVPSEPVTEQEFDDLKQAADSTVAKFRDDYQQGIFGSYQGYQSLFGVKIETLEDAIIFNNTHEGLHLGYILSIRKLIN